MPWRVTDGIDRREVDIVVARVRSRRRVRRELQRPHTCNIHGLDLLYEDAIPVVETNVAGPNA